VVVLELLFDFFPDVHFFQVADNRDGFEEKNTTDKLLGMFHLVNGALFNHFSQLAEAPVVTHLGMNHILTDSGQFV